MLSSCIPLKIRVDNGNPPLKKAEVWMPTEELTELRRQIVEIANGTIVRDGRKRFETSIEDNIVSDLIFSRGVTAGIFCESLRTCIDDVMNDKNVEEFTGMVNSIVLGPNDSPEKDPQGGIDIQTFLHPQVVSLLKLLNSYTQKLYRWCCVELSKNSHEELVNSSKRHDTTFIWQSSKSLRMDVQGMTGLPLNVVRKYGLWKYCRNGILNKIEELGKDGEVEEKDQVKESSRMLSSRLPLFDLHMMYCVLYNLRMAVGIGCFHLSAIHSRYSSMSDVENERNKKCRSYLTRHACWQFSQAYYISNITLQKASSVEWIKTLPPDHGFGELDMNVIRAMACYAYGWAQMCFYRNQRQDGVLGIPISGQVSGPSDNKNDDNRNPTYDYNDNRAYSNPDSVTGGFSGSIDPLFRKESMSDIDNIDLINWDNHNKHRWAWWVSPSSASYNIPPPGKQEAIISSSPQEDILKQQKMTVTRDTQALETVTLSYRFFKAACDWLSNTNATHTVLYDACKTLQLSHMSLFLMHASSFLQVKSYIIRNDFEPRPSSHSDYVKKTQIEKSAYRLLSLSLRAAMLSYWYFNWIRMNLEHRKSPKSNPYFEDRITQHEISYWLVHEELERYSVPLAMVFICMRPYEMSNMRCTNNGKLDNAELRKLTFHNTCRNSPLFLQLIVLACKEATEPNLEKQCKIRETLKSLIEVLNK